MSERDGGPRGDRPEVVVGQIVCDVAASAGLEGANLAGPLRGLSGYLEVVIPVTVRLTKPGSGFDLVVSAELCASRGRRVGVAFAPSPSAEYDGVQAVTSAKLTVAPGVGAVSGGVDRTVNRQLLVSNVTGIGTDRLEWVIPGGRRQLAGSHEFRFLVRQEDASLGWVEVSAQARAASGFLGRTTLEPVSGHACSPLVAEASPQAAATLVLLEGGDVDAPRFFVGRPLDLPLSITAGGLTVGQPGADGVLLGSIRWFDSVDGRPGFQWVQKSSAAVCIGENPAVEIHRGETVLLESGTLLRLPGDQFLRVVCDSMHVAGRTTVRGALNIEVLVDGLAVATYGTESDYVTVGRSLKDISIDRPDISRLHGSLEHSEDGWSYAHQSGACDAMLLRDGAKGILIRRGSVVSVGARDTIRLNEHVSLVIA